MVGYSGVRLARKNNKILFRRGFSPSVSTGGAFYSVGGSISFSYKGH